MRVAWATLGIATVLARPDVSHAAPVPEGRGDIAVGSPVVTETGTATESSEPERPDDGVFEKPTGGGYLSRPLVASPRFLDHGVLHVAVAGGTPHKYRLEVGVGLFDHVSLGVTGHWLPGDVAPRFSPRVAIAFWRWRWLSVGAHHLWTMYSPPVVDLDPETPSYRLSAMWFLGSMSFGQRWVSAGFDSGVVRVRENDPGEDPGPDLRNPSRIRWRFGGGLFVRAGTRRWGITGQVLLPALTAEVALDVRFGAFEKRPRGGWIPRDKPGRGGVQQRPWQQ